MSFALVSSLWLHEPDSAALARAVAELGLPSAAPDELAAAYTDVFLLNVPPYGTVFTDDFGELNGPAAQETTALFAAHGYQPRELDQVGAPDHLGLCLGFMAHTQRVVSGEWLAWMPVCCLAVEREPTAHSFYKSLAAKTREAILQLQISNQHSAISIQQSPLTTYQSELTLHTLMRFFLSPAQCGMYLSRSRLGQMALALGLRLPFGSRWDVAEWLFQSAGEAEKVETLIRELEIEVSAWAEEYRHWAEACPAWRPMAEAWLARTRATHNQLAAMRLVLQTEPA